MTLAITHTHVSAIADDGSDVGSNAWNAAHTLTGTVSLAQGGTNSTSFTANALTYSDGTSILSMANTSWDNVNSFLSLTGKLIVGGSATPLTFDVDGSQVQIPNQTVGTSSGTSAFGSARFANDANSASMILAKSRGALGVLTTVSSGDGLGDVYANGTDGTTFLTAGKMGFACDGTVSAGNCPGRWYVSTVASGGGVAATERLRIDSIGNVTLKGTTVLNSDNTTITATNPLLNLAQTWNNVATTGASGTGTTATLTFAAQTLVMPVGSTIVVAGVTPAGYNGTFTVTASTTTSVSYANATTGAQTVAGTVSQQFTGVKFNVTNTASATGSKLFDWQIGGVSKIVADTNGRLLIGIGQSVDTQGPGVGPGLQVHGTSTSGFSQYSVTRWQNAATSPGMSFSKSRGAAIGTFAIVSNGDQLGQLKWYGDDGTQFVLGAQIQALVDAAPSANVMPARLQFHTTTAAGAFNEYMRISGSGGISIGSGFDPGANIIEQANSTTAQTLRVYNTRTDASNYERGVIDWSTSANTLTIGAQNAGTGSARPVVVVGASVQFPGWTRVTSDFTVTSSTVLVNVTGLTVNVAAGRTYTFQAELYVTDAAAGGVQAAIAGTATATAIQYTGYTIADNAIKGKTNATALATAVGSTVTTETAGIIVRITGTITVNVAGTLTVQMAQNTSNGTATTAKRGSYFAVCDMA